MNCVTPIYVETSEKFDTDRNNVRARDFLWRKLDEKRLNHLERLRNEAIETAYVGIYSYNPGGRELFRTSMKRLRDYEKTMFDQLHGDTEQVVLEFPDTSAYQSAHMGNTLRKVTDQRQQIYILQIEKELTCLEDFLADIIAKDDQALLQNRQNQSFIQSCPKP